MLSPRLPWAPEVETDGEGLDSLSLREIIENWPSSKPRPKVLYTIPVRVRLIHVLTEYRFTLLLYVTVWMQPDGSNDVPHATQGGIRALKEA